MQENVPKEICIKRQGDDSAVVHENQWKLTARASTVLDITVQSSKHLAGRNVLYNSFESVVSLISDQKSP